MKSKHPVRGAYCASLGILKPFHNEELNRYKNQRAYFDIGIVDKKGLMILKNVLSSFMASYLYVKIIPRFL